MALVLTQRFTLEPNQLEEGIGRSTDQHFGRLLKLRSTGPLPGKPAALQDLGGVVLLELQADEELGRAVKHWVCSDEEALLRIDANHEGRVEAVRILPEV